MKIGILLMAVRIRIWNRIRILINIENLDPDRHQYDADPQHLLLGPNQNNSLIGLM
jgi:hypothetical protein